MRRRKSNITSMKELDTLLSQFTNASSHLASLAELENLKITYLGRHGIINALFQQIKALTPHERKSLGLKLNTIKKTIEQEIEKITFSLAKQEGELDTDITLPGKPYPKGSLHIVTLAVEEITRIFSKLGFIRITYPEVEWEYFSFDSLNMPPNHPGRDDFETFFIEASPSRAYGKMILSPHTSSGQVREMLRVGTPPIRMISIAKTYRPNWDTTHTPMFHQFESLCVDRGVNITNLKGTIDYFAKEFFGENREIRLRPHHFQFTEPSFEVDITCGVCLGKGIIESETCRVCKSGWLEIAGAGMVHPNVLKAGKIDSQTYTGWAFAFGLERLMMMKEGIQLDDMRVMYSGDIRFLKQF